MRFLARLILDMFGWKVQGGPPPFKKMIILEAPHTSNWDFVLGKLQCVAYGIKPLILIKKEMFFFPLGFILRGLGAFPVERGRKNNMVDNLVKEFNEREVFSLIITPEGTRKKRKVWKKGFYLIADKAKIPIILGFLDYKKKIVGLDEVFHTTGDIDKDMKEIQLYYKNIHPRFPENYHSPV